MANEAVTGRLAPSPTGALHLGHALSFLAAYWSAKSVGGRVILRLEDVDSERASRKHIEQTLQDLAWLGLTWDGPPIIQSTRLAPIRAATSRLLENNNAYPCVCTRRDLKEAGSSEESPGAPHQSGVRYPGTCRSRFVTIEQAEATSGRDAGLRFVSPDRDVTFVDQVYGKVVENVAQTVGDFLVLRRNKVPAYQLAIVIDDTEDGVTEVVRGRDLLESTARQICIAQALGLSSPKYAHIPLVCDATGRRLAKRDGSRSLEQLRQQGISADRIRAWAARRLGQAPPESLQTGAPFRFDLVPTADISLPDELGDEL